MHLMNQFNSSQMIHNLHQEIKDSFSNRLSDMTGMDAVKSLADT